MKKYRSKFEQTVDLLLKNEKSVEVEYEPKDCKLNYVVEKKYQPDFVITNKKSNKKIYLETKGWFRPEDRVKMDAVVKCNPDLDIRILFMKDLAINNKAKKKFLYSDWCEKRSIPCSFGEVVPEKWLK